MHKKFKRVGVDIAGYGLIILALLIGWLPGPGGIPLLLAGLGLLSVNNHWAKRILLYIQKNGVRITEVLFPDNSFVQALHDLLTVFLVAGTGYLLLFQRNIVSFGFVIALAALALIDFLYNRKRLQRFKNK